MMRTTALLSSALFAVGLSACAPATEPAPELTVDVHDGEFATIQQFTTPAGVSVWLVEEPSIPILSLRMAWPAGQVNDPEGAEGLTAGTMYLMNEGAGDLDAQGFIKRMEDLNMSFGCSASNESTFCNATMLTDNVSDSFDLIALAFDDPSFDDSSLERYKRELEVSINERETDPGYLASRAQIEALYPDHAYARQLTMESVATFSTETMKAQADRILVKDGLMVTAVGAISPEELAPLIDQAVAGLPDTGETIETEQVVLRAPVAEPIVINLPQPQSSVTFLAPAMKREDPDFYTAVVLNYTLGGGGFSSRLMKDLRVERGLTYGVYTQVRAGDKLQVWSGGGQTKNESVGEFITAIEENLTALVNEGMTEEELADAKSYLTGSYPLGFDSNAKIAGNMMGLRLDDLPVDFFDKRNAMVEAVTLDDVNRVAREYLDPENFTFIVVGEPQGLDG